MNFPWETVYLYLLEIPWPLSIIYFVEKKNNVIGLRVFGHVLLSDYVSGTSDKFLVHSILFSVSEFLLLVSIHGKHFFCVPYSFSCVFKKEKIAYFNNPWLNWCMSYCFNSTGYIYLAHNRNPQRKGGKASQILVILFFFFFCKSPSCPCPVLCLGGMINPHKQ